MDGYDTAPSGAIINGDRTYQQAVDDLLVRGTVVLNWTDGDGSLFTILLSLEPVRFGAGGGLVDDSPGKLWVAIVKRGCFAFSAFGRDWLAPGYVGEKLGLESPVDAANVAELVNGIRGRIMAKASK